MIELLARAANGGASEIPLILLLIGVIAVCATVFMVVTWDVEPWTRKYLKPRKQYLSDWWRVRIHNLRMRHPAAFVGVSPYAEQHLDVEKLIDDVKS